MIKPLTCCFVVAGEGGSVSRPDGQPAAHRGHDCARVHEVGLSGQPDEQIMVTADSDDRSKVQSVNFDA